MLILSRKIVLIVKALYIWVDVMSEVGNDVVGYLLMFNKWPPPLCGHL